MQHFYESIPGWFNFKKLYSHIIGVLPDDAHIVEVGTWYGCSAAYLAVEIINSGKPIKFDVVDHFIENGGNRRSFFEEHLKPARHALHAVHEMTSQEAALLYPDASLDFCMIDAGHELDEITADIISWLPKIKPGGILSGDDYIPNFPGVIQAVDAAFGKDVDTSFAPAWVYYVK